MKYFTPLQVIFFFFFLLFVIFAIDGFQRKRLNILHFLVFFGGSIMVGLFSRNIELLNIFGRYFGLQRGADLLVYVSIIVLAYMFFIILNKITRDNFMFTRLVTNESLSHIDQTQIIKKIMSIDVNHHTKNITKNDFMFHIKWYNESEVIGKVIDEIIWAWFTKILVVNDGSIDQTAQIIEDKIQQYPNKLIILVNHLINRKHGGGNKTWIEFFKRYGEICNIRYVVFFDADGQMDIRDMDTFMSYIAHNPKVDVLQGSRFIPWGQAYNIPLIRKIVLRGAKIITYFFNWIAITDSHNGYKCFKLSALQQIVLRSDTTLYANELIDEYKRLGLIITELPVTIKYTDYSIRKWQKSINAFHILFEMIYRKLFFR